MTPRDNMGQRFSEDVERLLQGEEPLERQADPDYTEMMLFARRLVELREEPDAEFAGRLRRTLLTNMAAQDARADRTESWFVRMFSRPGLRLAVVSTFVVLAAVGLVWRAGLLSPAASPMSDDGPGMLSVPPSAMTSEAAGAQAPQAPQTEEDGTGEAPSDATMRAISPGPIYVTAHAAPSVFPGEDINISITFRNDGSDGYLLTPFPPAVAIRETTTGRVVYTFAYGTSNCALSPMESLQYDVVWDQKDSTGRQVEPGRYEIEVEATEALPGKGDMTEWTNAYNVASFEILSSTTQDRGAENSTTVK